MRACVVKGWLDYNRVSRLRKKEISCKDLKAGALLNTACSSVSEEDCKVYGTCHPGNKNYVQDCEASLARIFKSVINNNE